MSIKKGFKVRKIVKPLYLENYYLGPDDEPATEGDHLYVWVNISKRLQDGFEKCNFKHASLLAEHKLIVNKLTLLHPEDDKREIKNKRKRIVQINKDMEANDKEVWKLYSEIWSQHEDESEHMSPADVDALNKQMLEADPGFWSWLCLETGRMCREHREGNLKN
jgi:hypothetical protein